MHSGGLELSLRASLAALAARIAQHPRVTVASLQHIDSSSPAWARRDTQSELTTGFPYTLAHASVLAASLAKLIVAPAPRKGLITDLDDTLWAGLLGEVGVEQIAWTLDGGHQRHGLYQQFLASLASTGVMVAAVSRNDPAMIELAFARADLLLPADCVFPLQAGWGPKSQAIERILETWNVSSASVVFVDDSPLDLDEARAALPGLETMLFPTDDDDLPAFLTRLRELFGKQVASSEDELRLASVRAGSSYRRDAARTGAGADEFLAQVNGCVEFSCADTRRLRALELINKTSQFNLNGGRLTERELQRALDEREMQLVSASYADRYGPLGVIAALLLERRESDLVIRTWVMSCRALSRRIEHHCLRFVFDAFAVDRVTIDYQPTDRNAPFREFLGSLLDAAPQPTECLTRQALSERGPALVHRVLAQDR
ncbi:MAG: HAD-IIIC family phosphatase [Solirubrobacteraceae bacterium]